MTPATGLSRGKLVLSILLVALARSGFAQSVAADGVGPPPVPSAQAAVSHERLDQLLERAATLTRSGRNDEAYAVLAGAEDEFIGEVAFDYALGRAALDAGRPDKATLAFSRVLALEPSHAGARIDMGRAYLALGDHSRAQLTFRALLALDPPPEIRAQLRGLLELSQSAAAEAAPRYAVSRRGNLSLTMGRSTNVNQSPAQSSIFVPALGADFQLAEQNVRKPDSFAGASGGMDFSQWLDGGYSFDFGAEALARRNFKEFDFDLGGLSAYVGLTAITSRHAWRVRRQAGRDFLGGKPSRDVDAFAFNYVGFTDGPTQLLAALQGGHLRHVPDDLKVFDANYVTLGGGAAHKVDDQSTVFVMVLTSRQDEIGESPSGNRRGAGVRGGGETAFSPKLKLSGTLEWGGGRYDRIDQAFETERRDRRYSVETVMQYAIEANLLMRFGISHMEQRSNIPIYEFSKTEWSLTLRHDF